MAKTAGTVLAAMLGASSASADLPRRDSTQFECKYEMDALPTAEDADGSGAADFTSSSAAAWLSLSAGAMTMDMTSGGQFLMSSAARGAAGDAWLDLGATSATGGSGYTIETLLKIDSQASGTTYALNLQASTGDSYLNAFLNFKTTGIYWGGTSLTNLDTTVWHTYRLVREGSGEPNKFSVYVDGELVRDGLGNGFDYNGLNRVILGSPGASQYKGKATVAYLRFTKGAYAPPAAPTGRAATKWSGEFPVQYEMTADDARFDGPTAGGTDWTGSVGAGAQVAQHGILSATAEGTTAWWKANDSVWGAGIGPDTAYTVEFKARVNRRWTGTAENRDLVFQFICGNPRDSAVFYVGANGVYWEPASVWELTNLSAADNTGKWHTFRLAYNGACQYDRPYAYTLWRDDVKIGTALPGSVAYNSYASSGFPNLLRFGIVSSTTVGGSFDVDYLRWATDGTWDYKGPPEAFVMVVR